MGHKILFLCLLFFLFEFIYNGDPVSELKANEETDSDCYKTINPQSENDCIEKESAEDDEYCCLFEIETHKKKKEKLCAGLTEFQYKHIKLYVKEKMDELLYRDLHIYCNFSMIKLIYFYSILFFCLL
jgi:hypothetical protein